MRRPSLLASTSLAGPSVLGALGLLAFSSSALANPQGGTVNAGAAAIQGQGTPVLQVNQSTDRAVIDWKSFDIAPGEVTRFQQPSASSAILNRIHDENPSQLLGSLTANGIVALVNPNGMVFGQGSRIDVGSLIATTVDIPNERFLTGQNLLFGQRGETDAAVVNQGNISVQEGGLAALVAPQVTNTGVIQAKMGRVALGAGEVFTVDLYGDGLVSLAASDRLSEVAVNHKGGIRAEGGTVLLTTAEAQRVMDQTINMDGWVDVSSLTKEAGSIVLHAAQGNVNVNGKLHADGAAGAGGKLQITGEQVKVGAGAILTALGTYGGGDVKIGGDYLGGGTTPRAKTTRIGTGAKIDASATANGKGGRVIVWSDDRTEFGGLIQVKGGLLGGDGGFAETSSKGLLAAHGLVDASSPQGTGGLWLLDPSNVTIQSGAGADVSAGGTHNPSTDSYVVDADTIGMALSGGTSVTITTTNAGGTEEGDLAVEDPITKTAGGTATLTLQADGQIDVNDKIESTFGILHVTLHADKDNGGEGPITVNDDIVTNGGNLVMGGGVDPNVNPARGDAGNAWGVRISSANISTGAGNISIRGQGDAAGTDNYGFQMPNTSTITTTTGNITIHGTGGAGTNSNAGMLIQEDAIITSDQGDISLTGTSGGTGSDNYGIWITEDAVVESTGTGASAGNITLDGTGGDGTSLNYGLYVNGAATQITSVDGDISLTGTGGDGSDNDNYGMRIDDASVTSTGATKATAGTITMIGAGRGGDGLGIGVGLSDASIETVAGNISITGSSTADGDENSGIGVWGSNIISTGTGADAADITLSGTGSDNGDASNDGIDIENSVIETEDGDITLTGAGGDNGTDDNRGIWIEDAGTAIAAVDGDITVMGTGGDGSGSNNDGISHFDGAVIEATGTGASVGTITLIGIGGDGTFSNAGIRVNNATISAAEADIGLTGVGDGSSSSNYGIDLGNGTLIESTGAGAGASNITLDGTGGDGTQQNFGIYMRDAGTQITTVDGDVSLTGDGGAGTGNSNEGIYMNADAQIVSSGVGASAGNITLTGTGGTGAQYSIGVDIDENFDAITTVDGDITITGTGGIGTTTDAWGVDLFIGARVRSTGAGAGAGNITITGTGGASTADDYGVFMNTNTQIASAGPGTIMITGQAGTAGGDDIRVTAGANVIGGATAGDVTLIGNTMNFANLTATSAEDIIVRARTAATTIGLAGGAGTLNLTSGELDMLNAGDELLIGRADGTGAITVNAFANWAARAGAGIRFLSNTGALSLNAAQTIGARNLTITTNADPVIGAGVAGSGILTLETASAGTTMGLAGGAGTVNYSAADLNNFGGGWSQRNIGGVGQTGTITLGARSWDDPVTFLSAAAGSITLSGAQTAGAGSNATFTFSGPAAINAPLDLTNATGGTQAITFNETAVVNADITSGGGDLIFHDTLGLGADIDTGGGDITLADDVTLTAASSIDTGAADITFAGVLDGAFDLSLATTGEVDFSGDAGAGTALGDVTIADASILTFGGEFHAATFTLENATADVTFASDIAIAGDIAITTAGAVTFDDDLIYGGALAVDATASDITFNGTLDGGGDATFLTTGDITFNDDVGATTRLGDVTVDPRHFTAGAFNAASFALTNGTGVVTFGGAGLNTTGHISIETNDDILGTYTGVNGLLDAGAGSLAATVSFSGLDISGVGANLLAGHIGVPGAATQAMANLISIDGVSHPGLPGSLAYTFAGFVIGTFPPGSVGGGGQDVGDTPSDPTPPIIAPPPVSPERPVTPIGDQDTPELPEPTLYSYLYASTELLYSALGPNQRLTASFLTDPGPLVRWKDPMADCDSHSILQCQE